MSLQDGYQFFLYMSDGTRRCGYAQINSEIKLQRKHYRVSDLIGHPFGTVFEVQGKHLVPVDEPLIPVDLADVDAENENDNRVLIDDVNNQVLQQGDIEKMRKDGVSGRCIVQELASNSTTFDGKTDFSKKKYLKKKAEKYILRCMLVDANSQTVCEQQYMKNPVKTNYLRFDTLAYMLSAANIQSGQRVMVFDDCMGIIVGSIMERLGGYGLIFAINSHENHIPAYDCVNRLNFNVIADNNTYVVDHDGTHQQSAEMLCDRELTVADYNSNIRNTLLIWHISDLLKITPYDHSTNPVFTDNPLPLPPTVAPKMTVYVPSQLYHTNTEKLMIHKDGSPLSDDELITVFKKRQDRRVKDLWQPSMEQQEEMLRIGVHSLVVASNNPVEDVPLMLPYIVPSGILVVYSQYQLLLAELFAGLKRSGQWINITMSENWMRKYQVLPMRTHPYMNMYNNSGYVLTATRVVNTNGPCDMKGKNGIRTGATVASTLRKKKLKLM